MCLPNFLPEHPQALQTLTRLRGGGSIILATTTTTAPALTVWLGPALACALSYALYNLCIKKAATHNMDPVLGGVLLQCVAALVGTLLWVVQQRTRTTTTTAFWPSRTAVAWATAAGLAVGAAELLSFAISGMGVPASASIPLVVGGSVLLGTLLGRFWLGEVLTWKGWSGMAFIALGIALVGMDPGSASGTGMH